MKRKLLLAVAIVAVLACLFAISVSAAEPNYDGEKVTLADGTECMSAGLQLLEDGTKVLITLREGKFHQVKRMTAACGATVLYLKRLSMGALRLDESLAPGEHRFLTNEEVCLIGGKTES